MEKLIQNVRDDRIDMILRSLPHTNATYVLAEKKRSGLYELLDPILRSKEEITISPSDCENFREFVDREAEVESIAMEALYRQGYLDCVRLLRALGVLA